MVAACVAGDCRYFAAGGPVVCGPVCWPPWGLKGRVILGKRKGPCVGLCATECPRIHFTWLGLHSAFEHRDEASDNDMNFCPPAVGDHAYTIPPYCGRVASRVGPTPPTYLPTPQRHFHIWVRTLLMNSTPDPLPTYPKPRDATLPYPPLVPNPAPTESGGRPAELFAKNSRGLQFLQPKKQKNSLLEYGGARARLASTHPSTVLRGAPRCRATGL